MNSNEWEDYIFERRFHRIAGNALFASIYLPLLSRAFTLSLSANLMQSITRSASLSLITKLWFPKNIGYAAFIGGFAGVAEDNHVKISFQDAIDEERCMEPEMWTIRSLVPVLSFLIHPYIGVRAVDGEMKGCNTALAMIENRPIQLWPFYSVLNVTEPSHEKSTFQYNSIPKHSSEIMQYIHMLNCRIGNGFYEVKRHPNNSSWNIF